MADWISKLQWSNCSCGENSERTRIMNRAWRCDRIAGNFMKKFQCILLLMDEKRKCFIEMESTAVERCCEHYWNHIKGFKPDIGLVNE